MVGWRGNQVFAVNEGLVSRRSIPVFVQPHPRGRLFFEIVDDRLAFRTLWKVLHKCRVHFVCLKRRQGWVLGSSSMVKATAPVSTSTICRRLLCSPFAVLNSLWRTSNLFFIQRIFVRIHDQAFEAD